MLAQKLLKGTFSFFKSPTKVFFAFFAVYFLLFSLSLPVLAQSFSSPKPSVIPIRSEESPTNVGISNKLRDPSPAEPDQDDKTKPQTLNPNYTPLPNYIPPGSPQYTQLQVLNIFHSLSCFMVGGSFTNQPCIEYIPSKNVKGIISNIPVISQANFSGGLIGGMSSLLAGLYNNKPLSSTDYLASLGQELGLVEEAHAQVGGSGASVLNPVLILWQISRNISYLAMILIFLVVGLMVMFRSKINPQTVINVQNALPGLIIGVVMITFSYFLASLIVDVSFVGTDLVGYYFSLTPGATISTPNDPRSLSQALGNQNVFSLGSNFVGTIQRPEIADVAHQIMNSGLRGESFLIVRSFVALAAFQAGAAFGPLAGVILGNFVPFSRIINRLAGAGNVDSGRAANRVVGGTFGGAAIGTIFALYAFFQPESAIGFGLTFIAIAVMLYAIFRLFLNLINCFLTIIYLTITAPFHFLWASVPGKTNAITDWIRNMLCNALVFPAVIVVFYFAAYLLGNNVVEAFAVGGSANLFPQPGSSLPLFGNFSTEFIRWVLVFAAIAASPAIPEIVCKVVGKPSPAGDLLGRALAESNREGRQYSGQFASNANKAAQNYAQTWEKWKGRPPTASESAEFILRGHEEWRNSKGKRGRFGKLFGDWDDPNFFDPRSLTRKTELKDRYYP